MSRCARCDFRTDPDADVDPRDQATAHALEAGHPLCVVCRRRSLAVAERQTCAPCMAGTRADLAGVGALYAALPAELGNVGATRYDQAGRSADEPLPGGDALVMLASGSTRSTSASLGEWACDEQAADPPSVLAVLATWEDDWRELRAEGAAPYPASVPSALAYLEPRLTWAADHHPAFDEFSLDVLRTHERLAAVTGRAPADEHGVRCLDCPARLVRPVNPKGLADHFECPRCRRRYGVHDYALAVRADRDRRAADARTQVTAGAGWGLPWQVAALLGVPVATVRKWAHRSLIGARCDVESRALEVCFDDAAERLAARDSEAVA